MRAWIASGKEDWRRPHRVRAPEPCRTRSPSAVLYFLIVLPDETPVRSQCGCVVCTACGLIGADVRPQTKRSNFRWDQGAM
jgi:hypothetical protein